jgi:hypothetical protein
VINSNIADHVRDRQKCRKRIRFGERTRLAKFSFDSRRKFIELLTAKVRFLQAAETSMRAACAPQIGAQKILCDLGFSLYIRVLRIRCVRGSRTERVFLSPKT